MLALERLDLMFSSHVADIVMSLMECSEELDSFSLLTLSECSAEELGEIAECLSSEGMDNLSESVRSLMGERVSNIPSGWAGGVQ